MTKGTLKEGESHPMIDYALTVLSMSLTAEVREAIHSLAIEDNRLAQICSETLRRVDNKEPISDRYLFGLTFFAMYLNTMHEEEQ